MRQSKPTLMIQEQGSFAVGGSVAANPGVYAGMGKPEGQTIHGDHAYVSYQFPVDARPLPLIFIHGHLQFSKTWETTADGREGFQNIFLRRRYRVYNLDLPRRGRAGQSLEPMTLSAAGEDQLWFNTLRMGIWPDYFPGVNLAQDADMLNQFFRQMTPNTGPFDVQVASDSIAALLARSGPSVLVSHSMGGGVGWFAALKSANVRGIVSFEPGSNFTFPEGEVPPPMQSSAGPLLPACVPLEAFKALTRFPIMIYYGDYIPDRPSDNPGQDQWRVRLDMARLWAATVNRHGGDATVVHLPDIGIRGNTHFPFSDLNNIQIAELMANFLDVKGLA